MEDRPFTPAMNSITSLPPPSFVSTKILCLPLTTPLFLICFVLFSTTPSFSGLHKDTCLPLTTPLFLICFVLFSPTLSFSGLRKDTCLPLTTPLFLICFVLFSTTPSFSGLHKDTCLPLTTPLFLICFVLISPGSQIDDCVQIEPKENNTVLSPAGCSDLQASVCEVPRATQSDKDDKSQESEVEFSDCAQDWVEHGQFCYKVEWS